MKIYLGEQIEWASPMVILSAKKEKATQQKYNKQQKQKIKIFRSIEKTVRFSKSHLKKHA